MYYISKKVSDEIYEITDTVDNIKEQFSVSDIIKVVKSGVFVRGVSRTETGYSIKIYNAEVELARTRFFNKNIDKDYKIDGTILKKIKSPKEEIEIPYGITILEDKCICGYSDIIKVKIPDSVIKIGRHCFEDCYNLQEVIMQNSVIELLSCCFFNCGRLKNVIISDSAIKLDWGCFHSCTDLEEITIPDSVTKLGDYCFACCNSLKEVTMSNSVIEIGKCCFSDCFNLKELIIPDSVEEIGVGCFCTRRNYYKYDDENGIVWSPTSYDIHITCFSERVKNLILNSCHNFRKNGKSCKFIGKITVIDR